MCYNEEKQGNEQMTKTHEAILVTTPADHIELEWVVPYTCEPITQETDDCPAEGGLEIEGYAILKSVVITDFHCKHIILKDIDEGSIIALQVEAKYPLTEEEMWEAADEANMRRLCQW
jgi:hypothetical protein